MGLTGRHRMRTHAGIPHGSSVGAGSNLMIYYQYNTGETGTGWNDQSPNNNDAVQESEELRPTEVSGGG